MITTGKSKKILNNRKLSMKKKMGANLPFFFIIEVFELKVLLKVLKSVFLPFHFPKRNFTSRSVIKAAWMNRFGRDKTMTG